MPLLAINLQNFSLQKLNTQFSQGGWSQFHYSTDMDRICLWVDHLGKEEDANWRQDGPQTRETTPNAREITESKKNEELYRLIKWVSKEPVRRWQRREKCWPGVAQSKRDAYLYSQLYFREEKAVGFWISRETVVSEDNLVSIRARRYKNI